MLYVWLGQREKAKALIEKTRPFIPQDTNMLWLDAMMKASSGEIAEALPLAEETVRQQPEDRSYRIDMSFALLQTHQYQRTVDEGYWPMRVRALKHLGRTEEATQLAQHWAAQGDVGTYFGLLNLTGHSESLVRYLEERWPDLGAFESDFPPSGIFGYPEMNNIALAYRRAGNQDKFNDAMIRVRAAHDSLAKQGLSTNEFFANEAAWYAMADDREQALKFLAAAVDGGRIFAARIIDDLPYLTDFEGDPEYEAIQARMIEHLNREREKLGLEPVKT
jgi:tetratricopeptide (TPR) repeat protein